MLYFSKSILQINGVFLSVIVNVYMDNKVTTMTLVNLKIRRPNLSDMLLRVMCALLGYECSHVYTNVSRLIG